MLPGHPEARARTVLNRYHASADAHNNTPSVDRDRALTGVPCVEDHEHMCADMAQPYGGGVLLRVEI